MPGHFVSSGFISIFIKTMSMFMLSLIVMYCNNDRGTNFTDDVTMTTTLIF